MRNRMKPMTNNSNDHGRFQTVRLFCTLNPAFCEGGVRHLMLHEKHNGLMGCFPKLGRRRLIDVPRFFERIAQNANNKDT
jgi:hypothetical protein